MLGNRAHNGLQFPSNLEEMKGLKEARHAAHVRSAAHPHPPRTRGVISASLEGSEPTLEKAKRPLEESDKRPFHSPTRRTEALMPTTPPQHPGQTASGHHSLQWR